MSDPLPKNLLAVIKDHPAFNGGYTDPPFECGAVTIYRVSLKPGWCLRGECEFGIMGFTQKAVKLAFRKLKPCEECRYRNCRHGPACQEASWSPKPVGRGE